MFVLLIATEQLSLH